MSSPTGEVAPDRALLILLDLRLLRLVDKRPLPNDLELWMVSSFGRMAAWFGDLGRFGFATFCGKGIGSSSESSSVEVHPGGAATALGRVLGRRGKV